MLCCCMLGRQLSYLFVVLHEMCVCCILESPSGVFFLLCGISVIFVIPIDVFLVCVGGASYGLHYC